MALAAGSRFGVFDVQSLLGVGGMGEVFRARDTRLGRDVALKTIPARFAGDRDRLNRLDREARALASLNHPGIAAIYELADVDGVRALVLELVEGETLDARLLHGPLPIGEALRIARAIAEALDVAHDRGLIHRDLKPGNIKLTPAGDVKLLDFGLAKALFDDDRGVHADTPTMTATTEGAILGTAAYMSPEQARGQAVDKRADVWAFGCVLYEMLAGRAAFKGDSWSDSMARTLTSEPDLAALPTATPAGVVHLIERCLQKDSKQRLRGLSGIELAIDREVTAPAAAARRWPLVAVVGTAIALLAIAGLWLPRGPGPSAPPGTPVWFEIPPLRVLDSGAFALSPDGRRLAFVGTGADGRVRMWERSLDSLETRPISGSEGEVAANTTLFWSPDSRFIGFYSDGSLRRIDREGGAAQIVCRVASVAVGGTWNRDNVIIAGNTASGLVRCPAGGGEPAPVTNIGRSGPELPSVLHLFPSFLPDGRHILYFRVSRTDPSANGVYIADLQRPPSEQDNARLLETGFAARYAPNESGVGRILFARNRGVWAVPFDADRLALAGEPFQVTESVGTFRDYAFFDTNGSTLVFRGGLPDSQLGWRGRDGKDLGRVGEPAQYAGVALSPDGTLAAVVRENKLSRSDQDIWLVDLRRNTTTRFTSDLMPESIPAWSADGRSLIFAGGYDNADVRAKPIGGGAELTLLRGADLTGMSVNPLLTRISASSDGRWLLFNMDTRGPTRSDIWMLGLEEPRRAAPLIRQDFDQIQPVMSPDRRWLTYVSNESGVNEVLIRSLSFDAASGEPGVGRPLQVSRGGGRAPRWRADGRELFFQSSDGAIMAVVVAGTAIGEPAKLFDAPGALPDWGIAPDGQRFLLALPAVDHVQPFTVVLNWMAAGR